MKITFVLKTWFNLSGGVRSTSMLAHHMQKRGHEILFVSPDVTVPSLWWRIKNFIKGQGWWKNPKTLPTSMDGLDIPRKLLDHNGPVTAADVPDADIVVATWWETAEWVAALPASKGAKVYTVRHHEVHSYLPVERSSATYRLPLHKVTISKWLVDVMREEYGDTNVSLVPNSVNPEKYKAPRRRRQEQPTVGMMYHKARWKGCDVSLKAFAIAAEKIPGLRMVAFGAKPPDETLPLPEGVEFHLRPPQEEIPKLYGQCDALLFGSRLEGFGRPALEAMACRTPVISTLVGGPIDFIEDGVDGFLVPQEDAEAMAARLVEVLSMPDTQWQELSDAAHRKAISYSWDDAAELFEKACEWAIERTEKGELVQLPTRTSSESVSPTAT